MLMRGAVIRSFPLALFLLTLGSPIAVAQQQKAIAQPKQGSGPTTILTGQECLECHKDVVQAFPLTVHGKTARFLKGTQAADCETCHGDGAKHKESGRPRDILSPGKMPAEQATEMCLACHSRDRTHASWGGNAHDRRDMTCASCHNEHHPKSRQKLLAKVNEIELCVDCHTDKRKAMLQRSTHLFRTEHRGVKVGCASCHNPHGGETRTMLVAGSTNELCYNCHAEKRGPFLWEHAPGRSDCNTCHMPHGSNNPSLLKARITVLCQSCHMHMLWRHQTVAGYDISSFNKGCANCHSQVHGSNHPSGKTFIH